MLFIVKIFGIVALLFIFQIVTLTILHFFEISEYIRGYIVGYLMSTLIIYLVGKK